MIDINQFLFKTFKFFIDSQISHQFIQSFNKIIVLLTLKKKIIKFNQNIPNDYKRIDEFKLYKQKKMLGNRNKNTIKTYFASFNAKPAFVKLRYNLIPASTLCHFE